MKKQLLLTSLLLIGFSNIYAQQIRYVRPSAVGLQNGTSWENAFLHLQDALAVAEYGDQIWVAEGVYYPTAGTNRTVSFELKNGVSIYGGFSGQEQQLEDRLPEQHPVILSGNIGSPDSEEDNSLHVLVGVGLDSTTVLEHLTVCDGHSLQVFDTPRDGYGAGLLLIAAADPTFYSKPIIRNCSFLSNHAGASGGAVSILNIDPSNLWAVFGRINPHFESCDFTDNKAFMEAGALYLQGEIAPNDTFRVLDCRFVNNYAFYAWGGAVYVKEAFTSTLMFKNCLFEKNYSQGGGGGAFCILAEVPGGYSCTLIFEYCKFNENSAGGAGAIFINGLKFGADDVEFNLFLHFSDFEKNEGRNSTGGSVLVNLYFEQLLNAEITDCTFTDNKVNSYFDLGLGSLDSSSVFALIDRCRFLNFEFPHNGYSYALGTGGLKKGHTKVRNCVFANNACAIFAGSAAYSQVTTDIENCTFFNNKRQPFGKRWYPEYQTSDSVYSRMNFKNCIIWETKAEPKNIFFNYASPSTTRKDQFFVDYSSINVSGPSQILNGSLLFGDSMLYSLYPMFTDTLTNDFSINKCSPLQDRGAEVMSSEFPFDINGQERIRFGRVDLGAYEVQDSCFVSAANSPGINNRLSLRRNPVPAGGTIGFDRPTATGNEGLVSVVNSAGNEIMSQKILLQDTNWLTLPQTVSPGIYNLWIRINDQEYNSLFIVTK